MSNGGGHTYIVLHSDIFCTESTLRTTNSNQLLKVGFNRCHFYSSSTSSVSSLSAKFLQTLNACAFIFHSIVCQPFQSNLRLYLCYPPPVIPTHKTSSNDIHQKGAKLLIHNSLIICMKKHFHTFSDRLYHNLPLATGCTIIYL